MKITLFQCLLICFNTTIVDFFLLRYDFAMGFIDFIKFLKTIILQFGSLSNYTITLVLIMHMQAINDNMIDMI